MYIYTYVHICTCTMHIIYNYWSHFYLSKFLNFLIWCWNRDFAVLFSDELLKWYTLQILSSSIITFVHVERLMIVSVQFSRSVVSNSLRPHESQHARPPCPSPSPGIHSNSCPSSQWCHPAISSLVIPFSSCPQSLPASESFPMSQLFAWGGQSIGVSALASFLPKNTQD